jgi:hypothetical protein
MAKQKTTQPDGWEIKDRNYYLTGSKTPLTLTLPSKHTTKHPLLWFDEELGAQRELKYATNQASSFVDEQKGESTMGHITFKNGVLRVEKRYQALQKMLSLYHPSRDHLYKELKPQQIAKEELYDLEYEIEAMNMALSLDIDQCEAILRVEVGSKVNELSSKEVKRDLLMFAKRNPVLFVELAKDDNVQLRNLGIKATEANIIKLSPDQRSFTWASNGKKLMTVPFEENPYSAFAAFLKTDEGVEIFKSIEKKLK